MQQTYCALRGECVKISKYAGTLPKMIYKEEGFMVRMDEIRIRIVSSQMAGGEREQMNIKTQGTLRQSEDASIIEYVDMEGDTPAGTTTIWVREDTVGMQKKGAIETEFVFEEGKTYSTLYRMPFGEMNVTLLPTHVDARMGKKSGSIELEYVLNIAGSQVVNRLSLNYDRR